MKTPRIYIGALAVFCIAALVIGTSGAAAMTQQGTGNNLKVKAGQFGPEKMLDNLTAQGYDVSAIRTASDNRGFRNCSHSHAGVQDCSPGCISRTHVKDPAKAR